MELNRGGLSGKGRVDIAKGGGRGEEGGVGWSCIEMDLVGRDEYGEGSEAWCGG
jgi:hypothetical protein